MKCDRLDFCVNVKEFWLLFVTREKAEYFYVHEIIFQSGIADPAELNVVCRSKPNMSNQTDSNAALLPYLTHQLGSAHEWKGVSNGPQSLRVVNTPLQIENKLYIQEIFSYME